MATRILVGGALERLRELPDDSVQCVVTSPPYWGLRDYGNATWEGGDPDCEHKGKPFRAKGVGRPSEKQDSNRASREIEVGQCRCGAKKQASGIGLEPTLSEHIRALVEVMREVRRVLRPACCLDTTERGLLAKLRDAEAELDRMRKSRLHIELLAYRWGLDPAEAVEDFERRAEVLA